MTTYTHLVVSDTNNVIDYIYASTRYKFIRGASALLDDLNTTSVKKLPSQYNGRLLSTGGGETRVLFTNSHDAKSYEEHLKQAYIDATDFVTLTTTVVERLDENEKIAHWLTRAEKQLRYHEIRFGKKAIPQVLVAPIMKRCESCHSKAAEFNKTFQYEAEKVTLAICNGCKLKLEQTEKLEAHAKNSDSTILDTESSGLSDVHKILVNENPNENPWKKTNDPLNYPKIGFVYADGKGIGTLFKSIQENEMDDEVFIKDYSEKSAYIHTSLVQAAAKAHTQLKAENFEGFQDINIHYALIGGDDLAAIMPAQLAPRYTQYLLENFKKITADRKEYTKTGFELAAGVVITKKSFPLYKLFHLAYDLMYDTKSSNDHGSFDFEVVLDSNIDSIWNKRQRNGVGAENASLKMNGYSANADDAHSFQKLWNLAAELKATKFPSSKIKGIYQVTTIQNPELMSFAWKEWFAHLNDTHRQILTKNYPNIEKTPFSVAKQTTLHTPLRDLFDLYEFIPKGAEQRHETTYQNTLYV